VRDLVTYDYAIVRVVPKVERAEFVNVGVIVSCPRLDLLVAKIEVDERRLMSLDSTLDLESVRAHLAAIPTICAGGEQAGPIGRLSQRERFYWLVAPRSTIIQTSPTHTGSACDLEAVVERLLQTMVRPPADTKAGGT
jgi:hypothetical protein